MTGAPSCSRASARVVLAMLVVAALPIHLTLRTVGAGSGDVVTPLGYTWSLSLWIVPTLALLPGWLRRRDDALDRRALPLTIALLASLGVVLDIVFGNAFFTFPNADANLRVYTWGYDLATRTWIRNIPIEEYAFYVFGIAACLLIYVWGDRVWFAYYRASDLPHRPTRPWPGAMALGVALVLLAAAWKAYVLQAPGFPAYFAFLVAVALVPATALYPTVVDAINWRSFSFTILAMFALSLIWEGTMAVEHGWWGYDPRAMIGVYVAAWGGVPIEEPFLWLLCPYTTIPVYHAIRRRLARRPAAA